MKNEDWKPDWYKSILEKLSNIGHYCFCDKCQSENVDAKIMVPGLMFPIDPRRDRKPFLHLTCKDCGRKKNVRFHHMG